VCVCVRARARVRPLRYIRSQLLSTQQARSKTCETRKKNSYCKIESFDEICCCFDFRSPYFIYTLCPNSAPLIRLTHTFTFAHKIMQDVLVACKRYSTSGKDSNCQLTSRNCVEYSQTALPHIQTTGEQGSIPRKGKKFSLSHLKSVTNYYKGLWNCAAYLGRQEDPVAGFVTMVLRHRFL